MADNKLPQQGCARGGRGALLLAALQTRRPGAVALEEPEEKPLPKFPGRGLSASSDNGNQPISVKTTGRGAMLSFLAQSRESSAASSSGILSPDGPSPGPVFGRGSLLSLSAGRDLLSQNPDLSFRPPPSNTPSSFNNTHASVSPASKELEQLHLDSTRGKDGVPINIEVNYIPLRVKQGMGIFEYHVTFNPQIDSKSMRFKLLNQDNVKELLGNIRPDFDGAKLFIPNKLKSSPLTVVTVLPTDQSPVEVNFKFVGQTQPKDAVHLYNFLFKKIMYKLQMTLIGRNFYDHRAAIPIPQHKLEIWPGYVTAVQEYDGGLMLNCDVSSRVLRMNTARDILMEAYHRNREKFQDIFGKEVIGSVVITRYNNKTYRIDDIAWDINPSSKFINSAGVEMSYLEYYKNSYDIEIQDDQQPMLISRPKTKAREKEAKAEDKLLCLVPELCNLTGLTDELRSDFKIMKDIATHTRVSPNQRQLSTKLFVQNVNNCPEAVKILSDWGLFLDDKPVKVSGRNLPPEKIFVGCNHNFVANKEADWGREMGRENVLSAVDLLNWVVVYTKKDFGKAQDFIGMMAKVAPQMGIQMRQPKSVELINDRTETYLRVTKDIINPTVQMVVFIMPTNRDDRYAAIKKLCCVEMPVPSQVINARTISQPPKLRSVTQKIALQINCKLGGELWALQIPLKNTMVVGVDVYHDPTQGGCSVVGFVTSLNVGFTRWYSTAFFQNPGQELADCLKTCFLSALRKYDEVNHCLPEKIIVYRDGVGDGQLNYVKEYEIEQFLSCFSHFQNGYSPSLTVVVVQKRINTRMFLTLNGSLQNPAPGSILDHTVTRKNLYDFFLISQHVRQGTVSPSHYIVIYNTSNLQPDHIQKLSYKLTHLYYNWPGTVRVPAPCQYAHKLAYLCGQSIHKAPSLELADKLFFL